MTVSDQAHGALSRRLDELEAEVQSLRGATDLAKEAGILAMTVLRISLWGDGILNADGTQPGAFPTLGRRVTRLEEAHRLATELLAREESLRQQFSAASEKIINAERTPPPKALDLSPALLKALAAALAIITTLAGLVVWLVEANR